jgi:hypothetical protein
MSSFICGTCGKPCIDSPIGYVTGCEHYPPDVESLPVDMLYRDLQELYNEDAKGK